MKTKLLLISVMIMSIFMSCEPKDELKELQSQLDSKKIELSKLKLEVRNLQAKIDELDTDKMDKGIAVNVEKLTPLKFEHFFHANGSFEAVDYAYISPEISGQITEILVKEGSNVKKDQVLAKLSTDILENTIREVKTALELSTTVFKKQEELWNKKIGSELDYLRAKNEKQRMLDQLKTLQSQLDMATITSPINGIVDNIEPNVGEMAMPGQLMMQVVNLDVFYLNVEVSESYLPYLKEGDEVNINLMAYGDYNIDGTIYRIANIINPENRSFKVTIKVKNENSMIKPNMLAEVKFKDFESEAALVVPSIIVKKDFNGNYLFVVDKLDGSLVAKKTYVETGKSRANETMIVSGLQANDQVIIGGYNKVVEGSLLSIK
ncbi:efflux RND transporter periplasmic adaptor subunit [Lentimicrobium sp. S6]|uniref:efflux RND transporter periplasmic adaptor subunit n=1 Tax=Lentimicrobium sp. S6 TaxID=2735872 RepID=UPI001552FCC5|nr:efflux RND transporter periplasmic adaptor subunit [Lentimicrobium sp. S6]NPD47839.1 efflux RND transporter periplasmic adaptor subunit [Lentimicrobium sp. S6]